MRQRTPLTGRKRAQLSAFIAQKRATDDRAARRRSSSGLGTPGPAGLVFRPERHGLSWAQCKLAAAHLVQAERLRPFTGTPEQVRFRRSLRIAGILSAVKSGRLGASGWGRRMLATKGGNVMRDHALHHLRTISPLGRLAAMAARDRRRAQAHWERTGEPLPLGVSPTETREEQHLRTINELWEEAQWLAQRDRYSW